MHGHGKYRFLNNRIKFKKNIEIGILENFS